MKFFNQPSILQQIGHVRLPMFLNSFAEDLKSANVCLPNPPDRDEPAMPNPAPDSPQGIYFNSLAAALARPELLPERLRAMLLTLEVAAAPENHDLLESTIRRRIPCVGLNRSCPVDCALELWFACPDEFTKFTAPRSNGGGSALVPSSTVPSFQSSTVPLSPPSIQQSKNPSIHSAIPSTINSQPSTELPPWPEPVNGKDLLDSLERMLTRFVVLPKYAAETLALWILHTYAFQLRDVSTYIGIESPEKRCGKTTLLTVLNELAHRALTASNISPPAFFRVIEDFAPTLLIDEADTFLNANLPLKGILNAGYKKKTAFVIRAASQPGARPEEEGSGESLQDNRVSSEASSSSFSIRQYSSWCPKAIATIDRLPDTLVDRCILIRMHRKARNEECERIRALDAEPLKRKCARFILDHSSEIAAATPQLPPDLSDRAADIWEPLLVLADLAGGDWPERARQAAVHLTARSHESSPIGSLLLDIYIAFYLAETDRLLTRELLQILNGGADRPWMEPLNGKPVTDRWLSHQLRPYGIKSRSIRSGESVSRGYLKEDFIDAFRRYIPKSEFASLRAEQAPEITASSEVTK